MIKLEYLAELKVLRERRAIEGQRIEFLENYLGLKRDEVPRREEVVKMVGGIL